MGTAKRRGRPPGPPRFCEIVGCDKRVKCHGFCQTHYMRWRRHGDPLQGRRSPTANTRRQCRVDGCEKPVKGHDLCPMHLARWKTHGDPGGPAPHYGNAGERYVTAQGYVLLWVPEHPEAHRRKGRVLEHRLVMEQHLGRPLTSRETVHHKNGTRDDNRLENLELWVGNHGRGASGAHCTTCTCFDR